eukprot:1138583-Pelagomonas_calceolata.AAC.3
MAKPPQITLLASDHPKMVYNATWPSSLLKFWEWLKFCISSTIGVPCRIHVSEATHKLLMHEKWEPTGGVEVKGKPAHDMCLPI